MRKVPGLLCALAAVLVAGGCGGRNPMTTFQTPEVRRRMSHNLEPTVRRLPEADVDLLWKAAHDYMSRVFPLDIEDEDRRLVESETVEWTEQGGPHRTRVGVQVARQEGGLPGAKLGVVAQLIEPRFGFQDTVTESVLTIDWVLAGSNRKIEEFVAEQIVSRYLLMKQGRDPDKVPLQRPIEGLDKKSG